MRHQRGHLLLAVLPLALLVGGFVLLSNTSARTHLQEQESLRHQRAALNEANAALADGQATMRSSTYTAGRNDELRAAVDSGEDTGLVNGEGNEVRVLRVSDSAEVWVSELSDGWFQVDAVAAAGRSRAHVRSVVRERDSFSRFGAFVNSHPLGVGGSPKGDIHTNRVLQLFFPDGQYDDAVTARDGFEWLVGATRDNTTFDGGYDDAHGEIPMPNAAEIASRAAYSDGALEALIGSADPDGFWISVRLNGDTYDLVAKPKSGEPALASTGRPLPSGGVIFVDGDIASLSGTLDGRVTVAATGGITITDSLRYVDAEGDPAYLNGLPTDPENQPYEPNPAYDGDAALGVMAVESILYHDDVPDTVEFNGFFFSAEGRYGLPGLKFTSDGRYVTRYDGDFRKDSYRRYGGIATDKRIVSTVVNSRGEVLSGFDHGKSVYDKRLLSNPPPRFLEIERPQFSGYRVVGAASAGGTGDAGFPLVDRAIGAIARAKAGTTTP